MKKKTFLLFAVPFTILAVLFVACSSNDEEMLVEKTSDYSKMQIAGELHNKTMSAVYSQIKSNSNIIPTGNHEVMLDSFAKVAKYYFDYECDKNIKSTMHTKYKYFLDSEAFYTKVVAHRNITRSKNNAELTIESLNKTIDSEYIDLDKLASIDEMLYALNAKNIISNKATAIMENIHNIICRSSEGTISDAEFQRQINNAWLELNAANLGDDSFEGLCIASTLYITQASFKWWKENQSAMPQKGKVAHWVALDGAGALVGGLFHCFRHWDDQLVWGDLALDCAEGAVCASLGCVKFK